MQDPSKWPKTRPPTTSAIVTPRGTDDREVSNEVAPRSKGKSTETREAGEIPPPRGEASPTPKKRKTLEPESAVFPFTKPSSIEEAALFDSEVKRFLTMTDIEASRDLTEEEEVELLHSTWIDVSLNHYLFCFKLIWS